jgi:hypothetical protein
MGTSKSTLPRAEELLATFDEKKPGYGPDHYKPERSAHYAMTYALYASAAALSGDKQKAQHAADWLITHAIQSDSRYGWPFPFLYKTYGMDSAESGVIYAPAQALCVKALLDVFCITKNKKYANSAKKALDYYKQFYTPTQHGRFYWYSDHQDEEVDVANVNALLMGQYARASKVLKNSEYLKIAFETFENLWMNRFVNKFGAYWLTAENHRKRDNNAIHAVFIVQGLIDFTKYMDTDITYSRALKFLRGFVNSSCLTRWHPTSYYYKGQPAKLWAVGMFINTFAEAGLDGEARRVAEILKHYKILKHEDKYSITPSADQYYPRQQAFVALGLARLQYGGISENFELKSPN